MSREVSIGRVKRDISILVNRVAYGGEQIILTSRGKPKAALISIGDYRRLQGPEPRQYWEAWLAGAEELSRRIRERRGSEPVDLDSILQANRQELDDRVELNDLE